MAELIHRLLPPAYSSFLSIPASAFYFIPDLINVSLTLSREHVRVVVAALWPIAFPCRYMEGRGCALPVLGFPKKGISKILPELSQISKQTYANVNPSFIDYSGPTEFYIIS